MRTHLRIPAALALALALAVPALAQSTHDQHAAPADAAKAAPAINPDKADLLHQEFVAKTAELRGKITARQAELETLLATKPDDEAAIKKLAADIATLRGALFEQTTLFRVRFAKETGTPIRMTRGLDHMGGHGGMMGVGPAMDMCGDKGKAMMPGMGKGMMMPDMGKGMAMPADAPKADAGSTPPSDKP